MTNHYCKICNTIINKEVFFIPKFPLFVGAISKQKFERNRSWPLRVGFCKQCGHLQIISPLPIYFIKEIYETDYSYPSPLLTGIGVGIIEKFLVYLKKSLNKINRKIKDILEIGCFDGYLLKSLKDLGYNVLGCDPSQGAEIGIKAGVPIKREFFQSELFPHTAFDLVIMRHLLEHIQNPVKFLKEVRNILKPNGLLAIETPNYQFSLANTFWCDFHLQHLSFFTPNSLKLLLERCGFRVISHKEGQMLYLIGEKIKKFSKGLKNKPGLKLIRFVINFQKRTEKFIKDFKEVLHDLIKNKKKIAIYGAGGHTTSLIILTNLKRNDIAYVVDSDRDKWGKFLVGFSSELKVSLPRRLREEPVDYIIPSSNWYQEDIIYSTRGLGIKSNFIKLYPKVKISKF